MFSLLFSFRGRLGRLHYALSVLALSVGLVVLAVLLAGMVLSGARPHSGGALSLLLPLALFVLVAAPVMMWAGLALQAKRFRDMGWKPWFVVPGWLVFSLLDAGAARAVPAFVLSPQSHLTYLGALVNLVLVCCLLFWPGQSGSAASPPDRADEPRDHHRAPAPAPQTATAAANWNASPRAGFGRRGL